jgi:hypothetical protein
MTAPSLHLEKCSPADAHGILAPQPIFADRQQYAVHAEVDGDGDWTSPGISFDDYSKMRTFTKSATYRQKPIPIYATDPNSMRRLIVRVMERRAFGKRGPGIGTDACRLSRAHAALLADIPRQESLLTSLCARYVDGQKNGADPATLRTLRIEIEGIDTQIRTAEKLPTTLVGIVYRSYCLGEDSVTVGAAFGILPPSVRQLLNRLGGTWKLMQTEPPPAHTVCGRIRRTPPAVLERKKADAAQWFANLTPEEKEARRQKVNASSRAWRKAKMADPEWRSMRNEAVREGRKKRAVARIEKAMVTRAASGGPALTPAASRAKTRLTECVHGHKTQAL